MSPPKAGDSKGGPGKRKKASRSTKRATTRSGSAGGKGKSSRKKAEGKPPEAAGDKAAPEGPAGREVTVSRETLVSRVADARRTTMVVLAFRAAGGAVITLTVTMVFFWLLSIPVTFIQSVWTVTFLSIGVTAMLIIAARFATVRSLPEPASVLPFLKNIVFTWVDPFREDRPHLLPMWLEAILWAPSQVLVGALPFMRVRVTGAADAEAAADVARRMFEEGEVDFTDGLPDGSAEAKGLRLLLLLRLARLAFEDGELRGRVSGLGQAALFEGTVG
ncbi:MAG: hypothetical protein ACYTKD_13895 [Planctomycetota bacterium]